MSLPEVASACRLIFVWESSLQLPLRFSCRDSRVKYVLLQKIRHLEASQAFSEQCYAVYDVSQEITLGKHLVTNGRITTAICVMSQLGPQVHRADSLSFPTKGVPDDLLIAKIATLAMTVIIQGNQPTTGLYGPLPVTESSEYLTLAFSFTVKIDNPWHPKMKPETTAIFFIFYPKEVEFLFSKRTVMEDFLVDYFAKITSLTEISDPIMTKAKEGVVRAKYWYVSDG